MFAGPKHCRLYFKYGIHYTSVADPEAKDPNHFAKSGFSRI